MTEMTLNKGIILQNSDFLLFHSNFLQNQVTEPCNNRLALYVSKDRNSISILFSL